MKKLSETDLPMRVSDVLRLLGLLIRYDLETGLSTYSTSAMLTVELAILNDIAKRMGDQLAALREQDLPF